jgi:hypothetical protein
VQPRRTGKQKIRKSKCPELYGSARRANAPACVLAKDVSGKNQQVFTVSTNSKFPAKNALAFWFLSTFAIELIVVVALAVLR